MCNDAISLTKSPACFTLTSKGSLVGHYIANTTKILSNRNYLVTKIENSSNREHYIEQDLRHYHA